MYIFTAIFITIDKNIFCVLFPISSSPDIAFFTILRTLFFLSSPFVVVTRRVKVLNIFHHDEHQHHHQDKCFYSWSVKKSWATCWQPHQKLSEIARLPIAWPLPLLYSTCCLFTTPQEQPTLQFFQFMSKSFGNPMLSGEMGTKHLPQMESFYYLENKSE